MKSEEFLSLIESPEKVAERDIDELKAFANEHPYSQSAQLLYAVRLRHSSEHLFNKQLGRTSILTNDREVLYRLFEGENELAETSEVIKPSVVEEGYWVKPVKQTPFTYSDELAEESQLEESQTHVDIQELTVETEKESTKEELKVQTTEIPEIEVEQEVEEKLPEVGLEEEAAEEELVEVKEEINHKVSVIEVKAEEEEERVEETEPEKIEDAERVEEEQESNELEPNEKEAEEVIEDDIDDPSLPKDPRLREIILKNRRLRKEFKSKQKEEQRQPQNKTVAPEARIEEQKKQLREDREELREELKFEKPLTEETVSKEAEQKVTEKVEEDFSQYTIPEPKRETIREEPEENKSGETKTTQRRVELGAPLFPWELEQEAEKKEKAIEERIAEIREERDVEQEPIYHEEDSKVSLQEAVDEDFVDETVKEVAEEEISESIESVAIDSWSTTIDTDDLAKESEGAANTSNEDASNTYIAASEPDKDEIIADNATEASENVANVAEFSAEPLVNEQVHPEEEEIENSKHEIESNEGSVDKAIKESTEVEYQEVSEKSEDSKPETIDTDLSSTEVVKEDEEVETTEETASAETSETQEGSEEPSDITLRIEKIRARLGALHQKIKTSAEEKPEVEEEKPLEPKPEVEQALEQNLVEEEKVLAEHENASDSAKVQEEDKATEQDALEGDALVELNASVGDEEQVLAETINMDEEEPDSGFVAEAGISESLETDSSNESGEEILEEEEAYISFQVEEEENQDTTDFEEEDLRVHNAEALIELSQEEEENEPTEAIEEKPSEPKTEEAKQEAKKEWSGFDGSIEHIEIDDEDFDEEDFGFDENEVENEEEKTNESFALETKEQPVQDQESVEEGLSQEASNESETSEYSFGNWLKRITSPDFKLGEENERSEGEIENGFEDKTESDIENEADNVIDQKMKLLDSFVEKLPDLKKQKTIKVKTEPSKPNEGIEDSSSIVTETLAKIYRKQGHYNKALKAYQILKLKYPEKSSFFAGQILEIKKLINK